MVICTCIILETPFSFSTFWDSFMLLHVALFHFRCCREFQKVYVYLSFLWMEDIYILSIILPITNGVALKILGDMYRFLNVHLKQIFASSTWPDIAKLLCEVLYFCQHQCQEVSIASHPCQNSDICCAFKTFASLMDVEMISYGKYIEFCLAHSRVWVRVSYYFNKSVNYNQYNNQYGLGTFSFVCWSLKVFYKVPLRSFSHCSTTLSFFLSFLI